MSSMTQSITYAASAENRDAINGYFANLGWGAQVLVSPLSPNGALPITHYGAHDYGSIEMVATMHAAMGSDDPALDVLDGLFMYADLSQAPLYDEALQSDEIEGKLGTKLQRYIPPMDV